MSFDPLGVAIDWLDAFRSRDLEMVLGMFTDDAEVQCQCCAMSTVRGKDSLRAYWRRRFEDYIPSDLDDLQPSDEGVSISYVTRNGVVFADLRYAANGQIAFLRLTRKVSGRVPDV